MSASVTERSDDLVRADRRARTCYVVDGGGKRGKRSEFARLAFETSVDGEWNYDYFTANGFAAHPPGRTFHTEGSHRNGKDDEREFEITIKSTASIDSQNSRQPVCKRDACATHLRLLRSRISTCRMKVRTASRNRRDVLNNKSEGPLHNLITKEFGLRSKGFCRL